MSRPELPDTGAGMALAVPAAPAHGDEPASAPWAVIDTNVLLDWLLFADPRVLWLAEAVHTGGLRWLATEAMLDELAHVLARPFDARWRVDAPAILATVRQHAKLVAPRPVPGQPLPCRDPDDQKFIDLALAWPATWLFSRDRALLQLARRALPRGIHVVNPLLHSGLTPGPAPAPATATATAPESA